MLQLLSPLSLFALVALLAPLLIHLLSRKAGKRIKVGSIQFLAASESHQLKSLQLSELGLLLLRGALLAVLAVLLARPQWLRFSQSNETSGWVLVAPEVLRSADKNFQHQLDSVAQAGQELRLFAPDFPPLDTNRKPDTQSNYWSLLRELELRLPRHQPAWIFSTAALARYRGERPAVRANITWQTVTTSRPRQWLQSARTIPGDSLQLLVGESEAQRTTFTRYTTPLRAQQSLLSIDGMPRVEILPKKEGRGLRLRPVANDTNVLNVADRAQAIVIYYDEQHREDGRYVQAALEAAEEFSATPLRVQTVAITGNGQNGSGNDFVFWLSELAAPPSLLASVANGMRLFTDAGARPYQSVTSAILTTSSHAEPPRLWRRVSSQIVGEVLWQDGFGAPVLELERLGSGGHYHFHSRFQPQWNELVLHSTFPALMLQLLQSRAAVPSLSRGVEQRRVSAAQSLPQQHAVATQTASAAHARSLHFPFWLLAAILFGVERWLSERRGP